MPLRIGAIKIALTILAAGLAGGWAMPANSAAPSGEATDDVPEALPDPTPQLMEECRTAYRGCDCLEPMFRGLTAHPDVRAFFHSLAQEDLYPEEDWMGAAGHFLSELPMSLMLRMEQGLRDVDRAAALDCLVNLEARDPEHPSPADMIREMFGPGVLPD